MQNASKRRWFQKKTKKTKKKKGLSNHLIQKKLVRSVGSPVRFPTIRGQLNGANRIKIVTNRQSDQSN